jgi:serine/threonine protein phosphatase PrpC/tRNA A-37 threonylcarbamoyl transferase component Bud32
MVAEVNISLKGSLKVSLGQYSDKGRKETNQDFHGACIPLEPQLGSKGIAIAIADGVSSSEVSHIASEATVKGFLEDYFCTSPAWSVRKSANQVLMALNSWLYSQTRQSQYRYEKDRGYVCTLSAMVIKSTTAHIFHVGDSRIYRLRGDSLEPLTEDHRVWFAHDRSYLSRALGINPQLEIDYQSLPIERGDRFVFTTDGVHELLTPQFMVDLVRGHPDDLDAAAKSLVAEAYKRGSDDNLTAQILSIDELPEPEASEMHQQRAGLPFAPALAPRMTFDGFTILRELHSSSRSHVWLATDGDDSKPLVIKPLVIKTLSIEQQSDSAHVERFLMEEWIARRIQSAHVAQAFEPTRKRNFLYTVTEYIDGQTLTQWMIDNPRPSLEAVRGIVEQIARGLQAFHRLEMLHQDVRPENVMIDRTGTVKIVDFGSTRVAGLAELATPGEVELPLGTAQYTAPEYFIGEPGTPRSDLFSLGVIAYQMLSGRLPYGTDVPKARTRAAQEKLIYRSVLDAKREIPAWIDDVLRKAVHPDPNRRYEELSELVHELRHPPAAYVSRTRPALLERNPVVFWKTVSLILLIVVVLLLAFR